MKMAKRFGLTLVVLSFATLLVSCDQKVTKFQKEKDDIIAYLRESKPIVPRNMLKGMESLNLTEEQDKFYSERMNYFIYLVQGNLDQQEKFKKEQSDFFKMFPLESKSYFYWSRDIFDQSLMKKIENKFGAIEIPFELLSEYYRGMVAEN